MTNLGTIFNDANGNRITLVGVVDAEVSEPGKRAARRSVIREACWDAVDAGQYIDFDYALVAYVNGELVID